MSVIKKRRGENVSIVMSDYILPTFHALKLFRKNSEKLMGECIFNVFKLITLNMSACVLTYGYEKRVS